MKWGSQKDDGGERLDVLRIRMVEQQLRARGIKDKRVLTTMRKVHRHEFVPSGLSDIAYADGPLPIGEDQTISQPYIVAAMSETLQLAPGKKVLEIGTGSGYQAAVLAEMGLKVFTMEFVPKLAKEAKVRLRRMGYDDIRFRCGDGNLGWPEEAPFDGIIVTAAPEVLPPLLGNQLVPGGRLVVPVGKFSQDLWMYRKNEDGSLSGEKLFAVRFVPLLSH